MRDVKFVKFVPLQRHFLFYLLRKLTGNLHMSKPLNFLSPLHFYQNSASENGEDEILQLARVKLGELLPEDGAAPGVYIRAVEKLSLSLTRNNAAIIELNEEDAALLRCALDSAKLYFRSRPRSSLWNPTDWAKLSGYLAAPTKEMYFYRVGRF